MTLTTISPGLPGLVLEQTAGRKQTAPENLAAQAGSSSYADQLPPHEPSFTVTLSKTNWSSPAITASLPGILTPERMIAFVDGALDDNQNLIRDLKIMGIKTVLLDPARDELVQIADQLRNETGLIAVRIFSHGGSGFLKLGSDTINQSDLTRHADQLGTISKALSDEGDIHLYGCDIAAGEAGILFIAALAKTTQADIAASINKTGTIALGGDWALEAGFGDIETAGVIFENYQHLFSVPTTDASAWTTANIASLTTAEIAALATDDLVALSTAAMASFDTAQITALTTEQIPTLTTEQIQALTSAEASVLTAAQIAAFGTDQIVALKTGQISVLRQAAVSAITVNQLIALELADLVVMTTKQIAALTSAQSAVLTTAQLGVLTTAQSRALSTSAIAALSTLQLAVIGTDQFSAFSARQIAALTTEQISALSTEQLASLTTGQIVAIETEDLAALTTAQISALSTELLASLTTSQIGALTTEQIAAFTTDQLSAISR